MREALQRRTENPAPFEPSRRFRTSQVSPPRRAQWPHGGRSSSSAHGGFWYKRYKRSSALVALGDLGNACVPRAPEAAEEAAARDLTDGHIQNEDPHVGREGMNITLRHCIFGFFKFL